MDYTGGGSTGIMSIPQLRKAFERIQTIAKDLAGGPIADEDVANFSKQWKHTFHKSISAKEAKEYLEHIKSMGLGEGKRTMRNATRKRGSGGGGAQQKGGGATSANLGGAPLDHTTQPGVYGTYGDFLPYVARGFGVGVPIDSQTRPALPDPDLSVSRDVGSGALLKGGGAASRKLTRGRSKQLKGNGSRRRKQRGGSNFILRTEPTTVIHDAKSFWQGQPMPQSPSVVDPGSRLLLP